MIDWKEEEDKKITLFESFVRMVIKKEKTGEEN
jgi:hypothetical protein